MPEISIKAETITHIAGLPLTNSLLYSLIVFAVLLAYFYRYSVEVADENKRTGIYYITTLVLKSLYTLYESILHDKIKVMFPLLAALFVWIMIQNWFGLLPGVGSIMIGVRHEAESAHSTLKEEPKTEEKKQETQEMAPQDTHAQAAVADEHASEPVHTEEVAAEKGGAAHTEESAKAGGHQEAGGLIHIPLFRANNADINATLALALVAMTMIQFYGIRYLGLWGYLQKFINLSNPINFVLGLLEIVSEISKIISFAFRLFGNIFAGEVLLTIVAFLVPVLASFPFILLEVFVGLVQALVFTLLTSVFLSLAVSHH